MIHWIKAGYVWFLPPGIFILICFAVAWRWRKNLPLRRFALGMALLLWFLSMPIITDAMIGWLESRHEVPQTIRADVVVLLAGGAFTGTQDVDGVDTLSGGMANRTLTAIRLARNHNLPLLYTGGNLYDNEAKQWTVVQRHAVSLGISPKRILLETRSLNTTQSVQMIQPILRQQGWQKPLVVTSAYHMPRSMEIFRLAGIEAQAWPCDFRKSRDASLTMFSILPNAGAMENTAIFLRELLGLLSLHTAYRTW